MFFPHAYVSHATAIDAQYFRHLGIEGLLMDVDGTLKDFREPIIPPTVVHWIQQLRADGMRLCILSNGRTARVAALAGSLDAPFVAKAMKPFPFGCRRGLKMLGLPASRVAVIGDQIFADVLAGRLAGLHTILVVPTSRVEPWFTRLKRPAEAPIRRMLKARLDAVACKQDQPAKIPCRDASSALGSNGNGGPSS